MTDKPEVMSGETLDIAEQRRAELKQLFPGVFTETTDANGKVVETVDFERLKAELGTFSDVYEGRRERYGMDWPGKRDCMKLIQEPTRATLKPCREESVDFDNTKNLFIEGDNLEVLKLLQKSYYGKVKMIYIDPPYNTGNEFIYPDNYQENLETYLAYSGQLDDDGNKFSTNLSSEGRFHTKWINMMYPRLYLSRNLLEESGVIFISIDDNEIQNLRRLCDEIFGEECFLAQLVWKCRQFTDARSKSNISTDHEYILAYARSDATKFRGRERDESKYSNPDGDHRGDWMSRSMLGLATAEQRPNLHYAIVDPLTSVSYEPPANTGWRYSKDRMERMIEEGRVLFPKKESGRPREKKFRSELENEFTSFPTIIDDVFTSNGTAEIRQYFNDQIFDFPKPSELIKRLIEQSTSENDICLDFFSGSCATSEAVYKINAETGSRRKFIAVQLPEPCADGSSAKKFGFRNISDIGRQRIIKSGEKLRGEMSESSSLPGISNIDFGVKVFKLARSSFNHWLSSDAITEQQLASQLELHVNNIKDDASVEDVFYELVLKAGFELSEEVDLLQLAGKCVFSLADGAMMVCLEDEINSELIDAVAASEPMQFICLDKAFNGNDQLKANAVQTFKAKSQNSESELVFKVV